MWCWFVLFWCGELGSGGLRTGVLVGLSCFLVWFCAFYDCFSGSYEEDKQDYGA